MNAGQQTRIVIAGGGVAGISAALSLARSAPANTHIRLVSNSPYFEYHGALYRLVAGSSPLEVCIPLRDIFAGTDVEVVEDTITGIDTEKRILTGSSGSRYQFDYTLLTFGAQTEHFGIAGLAEHAFESRTVHQALVLKDHINTIIKEACAADSDEERLQAGHMVVVGAGATGIEVAGELASYTRSLCAQHGMHPSFVTIELVEAAPRVLPKASPRFSRRIERRLRDLRVNILTNRLVESVEPGRVCVRGMEIDTRTVIWSAGVRASETYEKLGVFQTNKKGAVVVDQYLRADGFDRIFVAGDGAATTYAGWAQTALADGAHVAAAINASMHGAPLPGYTPKAPYSVVPVGPAWAAADLGRFHLYGILGWAARRVADWRVYSTVLPFWKALAAFMSGNTQRRMLGDIDIEA